MSVSMHRWCGRVALMVMGPLAAVATTGRALAQTPAGLPPPPPPPPWEGTSTAGSLLLAPRPVEAPPAPPAPPAEPDKAAVARDAALEARVAALQASIEELRQASAGTDEKLAWLKKFRVSGFIQGQGLWQWFNDAASPNLVSGSLPPGISANSVVAKPDPTTGLGITTNGDYFRIRRARLKTEFMPTEYARLVFEIDPTPPGWNGGVGTIARQVEAQGIAHWTREATTEFAVGIFKVPFGFEILQSDADRPFLERSWGERNMFPGEYDTGARAYTTALHNRLNVQVAVVNGIMEGEKTFALIPDLNQGKDVVGRANYDFGPFDVGVSGYYGQGQIVDPVGLRFKEFPRWAANVELALHHTFCDCIGETRLFAEGVLAQNMDRGLNYAYALPAFPADVVNDNVTNLNERSVWGRLEQDLTHWLTLALRYDLYTPDASQSNDGRATYGAVAVVHFTTGLQYMLEFDHAVDNTHAPGSAAPGKEIEQLSNALQVRF